MVYLSTLEVVKARARGVCEALDLPIAHGIADAAGRDRLHVFASARRALDIISQRQMVQGLGVMAAEGLLLRSRAM